MRKKIRHQQFETLKRKCPILIIFLIIFVSIIGVAGYSRIAMGFETEVGVTEDTIKIGTFAPFSGRAALYGKIDHSVQIVYKYINEEGGIHGRKLEIITEDTGCDPKGAIAKIVEILNETNEVLDDMLFLEGNLPTGHKTTIRSGLPSATWRLLNYGVQPSKSRTVQVTDTVGMLEDYAESVGFSIERIEKGVVQGLYQRRFSGLKIIAKVAAIIIVAVAIGIAAICVFNDKSKRKIASKERV